MSDIDTTYLSMAHIVAYNPIRGDSDETKKEYLSRLKKYLRASGRNQRKFESSEAKAYETIIMNSAETGGQHDITYYKYFILFDLMHMLAYRFQSVDSDRKDRLKEQYNRDFGDSADLKIVDKIFRLVSDTGIGRLLKEPELETEREYIRLIYYNLKFRRQKPFNILVTATMSAGKSTFINALTGKYVCLSQNMACTSKIHCIVNKAFEDGFSSEYDHDLVLTAGKEELLHDNESNSLDKIVVGTRFIGGLADQRIVINDSPGVNFSGEEEHKKITDRLIRKRDYDLLIYVMNATQLSTNDESEHLDFVRKTIGRKPVIFIINKIDSFDVEEEDVEATIQRQAKMLQQKGFKNPVICPVSAKAGYLAKHYGEGKLSRYEERELYNYIDKFDRMGLAGYYAGKLKNIKVTDAENEETQLVKTSGLAYVEKLIIVMCKGGNKNAAGTR